MTIYREQKKKQRAWGSPEMGSTANSVSMLQIVSYTLGQNPLVLHFHSSLEEPQLPLSGVTQSWFLSAFHSTPAQPMNTTA